jgi:Zn-dependent protease with chaperone function
MYTLALGAFVGGILIILFLWRIGERKKIIDQFESDVRIFLVIILLVSFYFYLISICVLYLKFYIFTHELKYLIACIYLTFPLLLGIFLYLYLPSVYKRTLQLTDIPTPAKVQKIGSLLGLSHLTVKTTPFKIPPFVYGRRKKSSVFVLPEPMESFLPDKEQKAVIFHELSHIKQGDTGFFTWLTLLMEGFKYWILFFPIVTYFGILYPFFDLRNNPVFIVLISLFFVSLYFLKNSLSRTRESIADAYVIFHGFEPFLKRALIRYAALKTIQPIYCSALWFYHDVTVLKPVLATHPPLRKRLYNIEEKTYLAEDVTNFSTEIAIWTGIASAFLFYTIFQGVINFETVFEFFWSESADSAFWVILFYGVACTVAVSYTFPTTKSTVLFSDLANTTFLFPLIRNWAFTVAAAAGIYYGLSPSLTSVQIVIISVLGGIVFWIMGFAASRPTDFSNRPWYLAWGLLLWGILLWYPLQVILTYTGEIEPVYCYISLFGLVLFMLCVLLILIEEGYIRIDQEEKIVIFFGKVTEFPRINELTFVFLAAFTSFVVPVFISFGIYSVSMLCGFTRGIILFFGIISILVFYGVKKSDILFFREIFYLVDILLEHDIDAKDFHFIQKVTKEYQSLDGGFDYAGLGFSNQKDTYHVIKTAKTLGIQLESAKIAEWIQSTEIEGGAALIAGGLPRVEAVYYAVKSLSLLNLLKNRDFAPWICNAFNGIHFTFANDTHSLLLQTCYAVESLSLLHALNDFNSCAEWIKTHFSDRVTHREAFFAIRALSILGAHTDLAEQWLKKNDYVLNTRLDKNVETIYYYVKILRELGDEPPLMIVDQAVNELAALRKKYRKRFGL